MHTSGSSSVYGNWYSDSKPLTTLLPSTTASAGLDTLVPFSAFQGGVFPSVTPGVTGITLNPATNSLFGGSLLAMANAPDSNLMYAGSRKGRIETFDPSAPPAGGTLFMDIQDRVVTVQDSGLLGMAFHPEFGQPGSPNRGYFYVYYVTDQVGEDEFIRLSRFTRQDGQTVGDKTSELVMIQQRLGPTLHRGGGLLFAPDGYLYLSIGDLGERELTQDITNKFIGGVFRIDVDQDLSRSHAIPKQTLNGADPDSFNTGYTIPNDNPWVGTPNALEEFYAVGTRNPHRMTIDDVTGRILIGEVGANTSDTDDFPESYEEINELSAGANFGWPFREAYTDALVTPRPSPLLGTLVDPNFAYPRSVGPCIIGGFVYRGSLLPELSGRYVFADCVTDEVFAMADDAGNGPMELLTTTGFQTTTFGIDDDGELYLGGGGSTVHKLVPAGPPVSDPPALLSATGAFSDLAALTPAAGYIPYAMNTPLWSDAADKYRWVAVPNDGNADTAAEQIAAGATGDWAFPVGTVFIKHFELPLSDGTIRRLETRFLVHSNDGYYGLTYRWLPDGSDAELLTDGLDEVIDGQTWHYPSRPECMSCHNAASNAVLGPRTAQFNRPLYYPTTGRTANQMSTFEALGLFDTPLGDPASLPKMESIYSLGATMEVRSRSYLASNCAHCHRPDGPGRGGFDTQFDTPLSAQNLINGSVVDDFGIPGAAVIVPQDSDASILFMRLAAIGGPAMPPLAKNIAHASAVELFDQWIDAVNESPGGATPTANSQSVNVTSGNSVGVTLSGTDADGDALDVAVTQMPAHGILTGTGTDLTYTPLPGYTGSDSFQYVTYDGANTSAAATVTISVNP